MITLRDYQQQALQEVRCRMREGARSVLIVSPTGSGKGTMAAYLLEATANRGRRGLFLVHRREIVKEVAQRLRQAGLHDLGLILAGSSPNREAPLQIASLESLRGRERPPADLIIWDECHHAVATTYQEVRGWYPSALHIGLTATPERGDGHPLGDVFESLVVATSVSELTARGFLVPCSVEAPPEKLQSRTIAQDPALVWQQRCAGRKTVLYASSVAESLKYAEAFRALGVRTAHIDGTTPIGMRDEALRELAEGRVRVVCNVGVLTEGWDCPSVEVCLVARHVGHAGLWLQMIGRVLRPAPGKERALVLDLAGNVHEHGLPEDERIFSLKGKGIQCVSSEALVDCPKCGAVLRGHSCDHCGARAPQGPMQVVEAPLAPVTAPASLDHRVERLIRIASARGYQPGWIYHAYQERFRTVLPLSAYRAARERLLEAQSRETKSPGDAP